MRYCGKKPTHITCKRPTGGCGDTIEWEKPEWCQQNRFCLAQMASIKSKFKTVYWAFRPVMPKVGVLSCRRVESIIIIKSWGQANYHIGSVAV